MIHEIEPRKFYNSYTLIKKRNPRIFSFPIKEIMSWLGKEKISYGTRLFLISPKNIRISKIKPSFFLLLMMLITF